MQLFNVLDNQRVGRGTVLLGYLLNEAGRLAESRVSFDRLKNMLACDFRLPVSKGLPCHGRLGRMRLNGAQPFGQQLQQLLDESLVARGDLQDSIPDLSAGPLLDRKSVV